MSKTFEPQYQWQIELRDRVGPVELGLTSGATYLTDPKRLGFLLSRYKFAAKMCEGRRSILEVGCGDGFGSQLLIQSVGTYVGVDVDEIFIRDCQRRFSADNRRAFNVHNILDGGIVGYPRFDSAVSLDVLEHIDRSFEDTYFINITESLVENGIFIVGMPSLESQPYSSDGGVGHINCKTGSDLKALCQTYFENVFLFSMNDEVVHTGYSRMAHYVICICVGPLRFRR